MIHNVKTPLSDITVLIKNFWIINDAKLATQGRTIIWPWNTCKMNIMTYYLIFLFSVLETFVILYYPFYFLCISGEYMSVLYIKIQKLK